MSTAHKIAIALVVLIVTVSTASTAVAAIDQPEDWEDPVADGDELDEVYIHVTEETVQFRVDIDGGGLNESEEAVQVYIDNDLNRETGINSDTVSDDDDWEDFYDNLDNMGADFRVSVISDGTGGGDAFDAEIQEHVEDTVFSSVQDIETEWDENDDDEIVFEIEKETIDDPEEFDVKFVYMENTGEDFVDNLDDGTTYYWEPDSAVRVSGDPEDEAAETATIEATVEFDDEVSEDAVEFTLADDEGDEEINDVEHDATNAEVTGEFTVDPNNFNGDGELSVEVVDDNTYPFDRDELNNTLADGINVDENDEEDFEIGLAVIETTVEFGEDPIDDGASVAFTVEDDDGTETDREVDLDDNEDLVERFTINPVDFDDNDGEVSVEVIDDEDYPFVGEKDLSGITDDPSGGEVTFDADINIDHTFEFAPQDTNIDIDGDSSGTQFEVNVSLESDDEDIETVLHVIDFDAEIDESEVDVDFNDTFDNDNYFTSSEVLEGDNQIEIEMWTLENDEEVVAEDDGNELLYTIEFALEEGLEDEIDADEEIELAPSTADGTEILNENNEELIYDTEVVDVTTVENDNTQLTDVDVTHLTAGGDMVGADTQFEVEIDTNEGDLNIIKLVDEDGDGITGDTTIVCDGASFCEGTLEFNPDDATYDAGYVDTSYEIEVVTEDSGTVELVDEEFVDEDELTTTIYEEYDVARNQPGEVQFADVREVIGARGADGGLPWDDDELARADVTNSGDVSITDVTAVIDEYNP